MGWGASADGWLCIGRKEKEMEGVENEEKEKHT